MWGLPAHLACVARCQRDANNSVPPDIMGGGGTLQVYDPCLALHDGGLCTMVSGSRRAKQLRLPLPELGMVCTVKNHNSNGSGAAQSTWQQGYT